MSSRDLGAVLGFAVGSFFGFPQLGFIAGSVAGTLLGPRPDGPDPGDLSAPGLTLGSGIPRAYGCVRLPVQWIWASEWRATQHGSSGGKGSPSTGPSTLTYSIDVAGVICSNIDINDVSRQWRNKRLIYSTRPESSPETQATSAQTDNWEEFGVMHGGPTQVPWSVYEDAIGTANASAWRHCTAVTYRDFQCGSAKQLPQMEVEVNGGTAGLFEDGFSGSGSIDGHAPDTAPAGFSWALESGELNMVGGHVETTVGGTAVNADPIAYEPIRPFSMEMTSTPFVTGLTEFAEFQIDGDVSHSISIGSWFPTGLEVRFAIDGATYVYPITDAQTTARIVFNEDDTVGLYIDGVLMATEAGVPPTVVTDVSLFVDGEVSASNQVSGVSMGPFVGTESTVTTLAAILEAELALNPAYDASLYDFSDVASVMVDGYIALGSFAEVAADLCNIFSVDICPGPPITFKRRGSATVATIPNRDTGMGEGQAGELFPGLKRHNDVEIAAVKAIKAPDLGRNHEPLFVRSDRLTTESDDISVISTRTVLTPARAQGIADTASIVARLSRHTKTIPWSDKYARLQPGDSVSQFDHLGNAWRLHIAKMVTGNGLNVAEVELEDAAAFVETGITDETQANSFEVAIPVDTEGVFIDGPILEESQNDAGAFSAVSAPLGSPFPGAEVIRGVDGVTYPDVVASHTTRSIVGEVTVPLNRVTRNRWDRYGSLTVNVGDQTLTASSRAAMQADRTINGAFVGSAGRWTFLRFVGVEIVSPGVYELTDILVMRDMFDAAEAMQAGDSFVLADSSIRRMTWATPDLNLLRHLKAVTVGRPAASADDVPFTNTGVGLTPFAPGGVSVARDGSGNATFSVARRGRLPVRPGGPGGTYAPLGETDRRSVVEVYADDTYATLVRTLNTPSGSDDVAYSAALQTSDGFTPGERLSVRAYHVSAQVGRGHYREKAAA